MTDQNKSFRVTDRRHSTLSEEPREANSVAPPMSEPAAEQGPTPSGDERVDFASFVVSLAAQAGAHLEGGKESSGPDLKGARTIIGILEMLQDKTEGRRAPEETRLMEELLYQLRMGYLARSGVIGS